MDIAYAAGNRFEICYDDPTPTPCITADKIVYSIGQAADYPGGARVVIGSTHLTPILGPGKEIDGLRDDAGGVRVLGAASVAKEVLTAVRPQEFARSIGEQVAVETMQLPPDARGIAPSIRYQGPRIAEANRALP